MLTRLRKALSDLFMELAIATEPRDRELESAISSAITTEALTTSGDAWVDEIIAGAKARMAANGLSDGYGTVSEECASLSSPEAAALALRTLAAEVQAQKVIGFRVTVTWHGTPTIAVMTVEPKQAVGEA